MTTYEAARAALGNLNARVRNLRQPHFSDFSEHDMAEYLTACEIHSETRKALHAEAMAAGFIRIFDGSYKLNLAKMEVETHDKFGGTTGAPLPGFAS